MGATIEGQLAALASQKARIAYEVLVADNGSTDDTADRVGVWIGRVPGLALVDASAQVGRGYAKNCGVAAASGALLTFCDADDVVSETWVDRMAQALNEYPLVGGSVDLDMLNTPRVRGGYTDSWSAPLDDWGFLPAACSNNLGVRREVYQAVGGFDTAHSSMEDVDFSWRVQLAGWELHVDPAILVHIRLRPGWMDCWRQHLRYGRDHAYLYRRYRDLGMPRRARPSGTGSSRLTMLRRSSEGAIPFFVIQSLGVRVGRVLGSLRHHVIYL